MMYIDENTMRLFLDSGNVARFELRQSNRGFGAFLFINRIGADEPQEAMLITSRMKQRPRKSPRSWASVDSFCDFVKARAVTPPEIRILCHQRGKPTRKQ